MPSSAEAEVSEAYFGLAAKKLINLAKLNVMISKDLSLNLT